MICWVYFHRLWTPNLLWSIACPQLRPSLELVYKFSLHYIFVLLFFQFTFQCTSENAWKPQDFSYPNPSRVYRIIQDVQVRLLFCCSLGQNTRKKCARNFQRDFFSQGLTQIHKYEIKHVDVFILFYFSGVKKA